MIMHPQPTGAMPEQHPDPFHGAAMASPDPLLQFIFAMFGVLTALSIFYPLSDDAGVVLGIIQVSLGIGAFVGSILNLLRGDPHGNINLILSVILGFAGGITQLVSVYASLQHWHFHPWILSVILLLGGVYMLCFLPLMDNGPLYAWISHASVILGFFCKALADLCSLPALKPAAGVFLMVFAATALYQGVSIMYSQYGRHLPQGPRARFWQK